MSTTKVTDSLRNVTAVDGTKITGTIPLASLNNAPSTDLTPLKKNIKLNSLRIATLEDNAFNLMVNGVTDAFTTEAGVNTGTSTNEVYSAADNAYANKSSTDVRKEDTPQYNGNWVNYTLVDRSITIANNAVVTHIWFYTTVSMTISIKVALANSSTDIDIVKHEAGYSHTGGGWQKFAFSSSYTVPATGNYHVACYTPTQQASTDQTSQAFSYPAVGDINNSTSAWTAATGHSFKMGHTTQGATANSTLVSNSVTAEAEPTTIEALVLHKPIDSVTIGTDYTVEVSIDNGTTYDAITMTDVGEFSTGINILRGSVDVTARTGTTILWRQKSLNAREQEFHGIALGWS